MVQFVRALAYVLVFPCLAIISVVGSLLRLLVCFLPTCCVGNCLVEGAIWMSRAPFLACMWVADQNTSEEE